MATISKRRIEVAKTVTGNSPWGHDLPEAASQTFKLGAILGVNSAGHITEAATDEVRIMGVAAEDGHNDSVAGNSRVKFWVADDETIFIANVSGTSVTHLTDVGRSFGIVKEGNNWHIDKTDTTNRRVIIVDYDRRDTLGDTNGRLHFMFLSLNRALAYTS